MQRVLLFSHTTGYQLRAFNDAAERLGIELVFATDRCHQLDDPWQDRAVPVRFYDVSESLEAILARARETPIHGVIAVGDRPVVLAAHAAQALGLPWHSVAGAEASTDKRRLREVLADGGLPSPRFACIDVESQGYWMGYPVVLKPLGLSGSRGVIRANDEPDFSAAFDRIRLLLARPEIRVARAGLEDEILVEQYIDGPEYALEGVLTNGELHVLALFGKPDPLVGPYFEETIYVTPPRTAAGIPSQIAATVEQAARVMGLSHGPVHAECRVTPEGEIYILEVAARPIGGLCSRVLSFMGPHDPEDVSLEGVLLQHALGQSIDRYVREPAAAAVMMIPIPRRGMFKRMTGIEAASAVRGVTEIHITAKEGQLLEPLPEAGSYLGFIFARGAQPQEAEQSVRTAYTRLDAVIAEPLRVLNSL